MNIRWVNLNQMNCWFVFFIFRARKMVDVSRKYMALMLKVYKQNLRPLLKFLEHA